MVRLTDRPDMTLDVYRGRKTTIQQQNEQPTSKENTVGHDTKLSYSEDSRIRNISFRYNTDYSDNKQRHSIASKFES